MPQTHQRSHEGSAAGSAPECLVCPLCMGIAALRESRPEALEHMLKAGAELLAALRALVDPAGGDGKRATRLQRIDIG